MAMKTRAKQATAEVPTPGVPDAPEMTEEWQVHGGDGGTIHVFTNRGAVFGHLAREWQTFVLSWDPTRTCVLRLEVRHVVREKHTAPIVK
jgi:hypothetical protein